MDKFQNYYEILQINENVSTEIIDGSYKILAKKYENDYDQLQLINEAYETLSNDQRKKEYDKLYKRYAKVVNERSSMALPRTNRIGLVNIAIMSFVSVISVVGLLYLTGVFTTRTSTTPEVKSTKALADNSSKADNQKDEVLTETASAQGQEVKEKEDKPKDEPITQTKQAETPKQNETQQPAVEKPQPKPVEQPVPAPTPAPAPQPAPAQQPTSNTQTSEIMSAEMVALANQFFSNPFNTKLPQPSMQLYSQWYKDRDCKGIIWTDDLSYERYPFVNDDNAIGHWVAVDYVNSIPSFDPNFKSYNSPACLRELKLSSNGIIAVAYNNEPLPERTPNYRWTQGFIMMGNGDNTRCAYTLKTINNKQYMFVEWKSGDYTFRHEINGYYVYEKK